MFLCIGVLFVQKEEGKTRPATPKRFETRRVWNFLSFRVSHRQESEKKVPEDMVDGTSSSRNNDETGGRSDQGATSYGIQ